MTELDLDAFDARIKGWDYRDLETLSAELRLARVRSTQLERIREAAVNWWMWDYMDDGTSTEIALKQAIGDYLKAVKPNIWK